MNPDTPTHSQPPTAYDSKVSGNSPEDQDSYREARSSIGPVLHHAIRVLLAAHNLIALPVAILALALVIYGALTDWLVFGIVSSTIVLMLFIIWVSKRRERIRHTPTHSSIDPIAPK